jgi:cytochrome c553
MAPIAQSLTDEDIADLAVYYAAQTPKSARPDPAFATDGGEALYLQGDAARGLAPCASCHGATGAGDPSIGSPDLRGQSAKYLDAQLTGYAKGLRYPAPADGTLPARNAMIMAAIARQLTAADSRALASYIQRIVPATVNVKSSDP